jgi:hypothetical protein
VKAWIVSLLIVVGLLVAGGCRRSGQPGAQGYVVGGRAAVLVDNQPAKGTLSLAALEGRKSLDVRGDAGWAYRLMLGPTPKSKLQYYGLPCYPSALSARQLDPSSESSDKEWGGYVVSLLADDPFATVVEWYAKHLPGWARSDLRAQASDEESSAGEVTSVIFRQQPGGKRRVLVDLVPEVGLTLVSYQILPEDEPVPFAPTREAAKKEEDVMLLTFALEDYRRDTGVSAESEGAILAESGPSGYRGPYLEASPRDPYSGKRYRVEKGKVTGPADVTGYGA